MSFDLDDFREQVNKLRKLGPLKKLLELMPGGYSKTMPEGADPDAEMHRFEVMIDSMTQIERKYPVIISSSRLRRIAKGSGAAATEVEQLLGQFEEMKAMMARLSRPAAKPG